MSALIRPSHIIITGASSGIGEALAVHYAAPGITLSLTGRNETRLHNVAEICAAKGAHVHKTLLDVTDREAMNVWLLEMDNKTPVDLLITNAGISAGTGGPMRGEDPAQARHLFDVNLNGVLNTIEPLLPRMLERGRGQIALMSSLAGFRGFPGAPAYCASKAAVKIYGESLRGALHDTGVHISVVCPGFVVSRMTAVNEFPMPLLMPTEKAARLIATGLAKNQGRIAFPFPTFFFAWLFGALPDSLSQKILRAFPAKNASH